VTVIGPDAPDWGRGQPWLGRGSRRPVPAGPCDPLPWHVDLRESVLVGEVLGVTPAVCRARWSQLTALQAHGVARLRVDVLVVEAGTAHAELDEFDVDPRTEHLWVADGEVPVAYLRVVRDTEDVRLLDRVCARADLRRIGLAGALVTDVVARHGAGPLRALAQAEAVPFFLQHGFEPVGEAADTPAGRRLALRRHPESPWRD
jgi:ElaA protein